MRIVHLCLAALLMTGAASCQKHDAESKDNINPDASSVEAAKPTPALPSQGKAGKGTKFGISTAGASSHTCRVDPGKPFEIKGWYISDDPITVTYDLNGKTAPAKIENRSDVTKKYPDYKFSMGWVVKIMPQDLKPENKLDIHIGNTNWPMTVTVK